MKNQLLTFFFSLFISVSFAQLPNGSTAPNWTMTDINGVSHTLYDYLDDGKTVFLDFSATWCGPCWNYHNSGALENLYDQYGPGGTDEVMVIMIEADASTNTACLYGPSGCNGTTLGNWVASTPYPIVDNASQNGPYQISFYPTIYGICPDKKITFLQQPPTSALYSFAQGCAGTINLNGTSVSDESCFGFSDGSIDITVEGSATPFTYLWSNGDTSEDIFGLPPGEYTCTITNPNGISIATDPITVGGQLEPLNAFLVNTTNETCFGFDGTIDISPNGGSAPYTYLWSDGQNGEDPTGLTTGFYSVTIIDDHQCTNTLSNMFVDVDIPPIADAGQVSEIDCSQDLLVLNGGSSSIGSVFTYSWTTDDGNIVFGELSMFPSIDAPGTYWLTVVNLDNNCESTDMVVITGNTDPPAISIAPPADIDCVNSGVIIDASASASGGNINYNWTTSDGMILSGATTVIPTVGSAGTYTLVITDINNNCTAESSVAVSQNIDAPLADAGEAGQLDCIVSTLNLDGSNSSTGTNITYQWSTSDGNIISGGNTINPSIDAPGTYTLEVVDTENGCSSTAQVQISQNADLPLADAGQTNELNCNQDNVDLDGSNSDTGDHISYLWTTSDGNIVSGENTLSPNIDEAGTYTLLVNNNNNGCSNMSNVQITANTNQPIANAGQAKELNCNLDNLDLDGSNSSTGIQINYLWTTSDGNIVSGENTLTPNIDEAGTYALLVTNTNNGCTSMSNVQITENTNQPLADAGSTNVLNCSQDNLDLDGSNSTIGNHIDYLWTTSDGNIVSGESTLSPNIDEGGTYTLLVTNTNNGCTATSSVDIAQDINQPLADAGDSDELNCNQDNLDLDGSSSSTGDHIDYLWTTNDGNIVSGENTLSPNIDGDGTYTLLVTNTNNGCTNTATVSIAQNTTQPLADAGASSELNCSLSEITLDGSNSSAGNQYNYLWTTNDGYIVSGQNSMHPDIDEAGTYTLLVSDTDNGCTATAAVVIAQNTAVPIVDAGVNSELTCDVITIQLDATNSSTGADYIYQWTTIDGNIISGATTLVPMVNQVGTYVLEITNNNNGCSQIDAVNVEQNTDVPVAIVAVAPPLHCNLPIIQLDATNSSTGNDFVYSWTSDDGNIVSGASTLTPSVNEAGWYELVVTNIDNGCTNTTAIVVDQVPELNLSLDSQTNNDCNGQETGTIVTEVNGGSGDYTYTWSNGANTANLSNLMADSYFLTVTDENDCSQTLSVTIAEPEALIINASASHETASGANDGVATVDPSGGTSPYSFAWSNGETTATIENLSPGIYTVMMVDANGCSSEETVTVNSFDCTIEVDATSSNVSCAGGNDGQASVELLGGNAPYEFIWSNGATTSTIDNLSSGSYTVTISDANNCPATTNVNISEPDALICSLGTVTSVSCSGFSDGSATVNVIGGTGDYTYEWSNGETNSSILNLNVGTYTVTVTDENLCISILSLDISQPNEMLGQIDVTHETAANANDGSATANPIGGSVPYSYLWNNGATSAQITGLAPGEYTVEITDANFCSITQTITVNGFDCAIDVDINSTSISCFGAANGQATAVIDGGAMPLSYQWSNGENTVVNSNLSAGTYLLTVTDANNCSTVANVVISEPNAIEIGLLQQQHVDCNGNANGAASLSAVGGQGDLQYQWSNGSTNAFNNNLSAGTYIVSVTDENNCQSTFEFDIDEPTALLSNISSTNETALNSGDGSASVNVDGGTTPYEYLWSNGATTPSISGLSAGTYTVEITDANGCMMSQTTIVNGFDCAIESQVSGTDVTCFDANNGSASILISGGNAPFNILWSTGSTGESIQDLAAGMYQVTVSDANDCPTIQSITISQPTALNSMVTNQTNVVCADDATGIASVEADGGTAPYNYQWSNGSNGSTASNLTAGLYQVEISDANQCISMAEVEILAQDIENPVVIVQDVLLSLDGSGQATLLVSDIDNGTTDNCGIASLVLSIDQFTCADIGANEVKLTATDLSGNSHIQSAIVTVQDLIPPVINCLGDIEVFNCDGLVEYELPSIDDNCTEGDPILVSGLGSGSTFPIGTTMETYSYTDPGGNTVTCTFAVTVTNSLAINVDDITNVCFGDADGTASISIQGGNAPFVYEWSNGQNGGTAVDLAAGVYDVTVVDITGCSQVESISILENPAIELNVDVVTNDMNSSGNGAIEISVDGGAAPYVFEWTLDGAVISNDQNISNLFSGEYLCQITDGNDCVLFSEVIVVDNVLSTIDPELNDHIQVYPNPTAGKITFEFELNEAEEVQISLFDVMGRLIIETPTTRFANQLLEWDLSNQASGVYLAKIKVGERYITRRIVVNR